MIEWVKNNDHFQQVQEQNREFLVLFFYADFSSSARQALTEIKRFSQENTELPVYIIDVEKVKGVHKLFGIKNVPTVVPVKRGKVITKLEGVQSAQFYTRILTGVHSPQIKSGKGTASHRVIVYSSPGCPACSAAKAYLRRLGVNFIDIDVSRDRNAADTLVRRSGQMAVPQIDIDGHLIVGFDRGKIDRLIST